MGARTLETKLRARLLTVVVPALIAVGGASVALVWWALDAADTDAVRAKAESTLATMRGELAEPDPFDRAAGEVLDALDAVGAAAIVRDLETGHAYDTRTPVPPALSTTAAGKCGVTVDPAGKRWRACAARGARVEIVTAIDVTAHATVVRTVAQGVVLEILLVLAAVAIAVRTSLVRALASVHALVRWSDEVVDVDRAPPPPTPDTGELANLATAFDAVVRRLVDAGVRARATSENIAHELRTPLTTMRAELEALSFSKSAEERGVQVERLLGDVDRLARVVDAILVLAVPSGGAREARCVVNLADVVRSLASAETLVDAPDEALVIAEPRLVELAIINLLENARKHTGREARAVRIHRSGDVAQIAVIDDGPGLDQTARSRMFERYWRGSDDGGGTGLGLALVQAVALLVGGIGVMNVMLASVAERTREIGVRLAVGATEAEVQVQFLIEAVVLSLLGGLAGVLTSIVGSLAIGSTLAWNISVPIEAVVIALAFSVGVGVLFGFYPAWLAARLEPVEALQRE